MFKSFEFDIIIIFMFVLGKNLNELLTNSGKRTRILFNCNTINTLHKLK